MRKLSLLLLALLVVSGTAFAQMVVEPTIEAEGTSTFGVDLDEGVTGIKTEVSSTISFEFVEEQTAEFGEGDVYGYIEVEDFKMVFDTDEADGTDFAAGDVTVMVYFGPAYLEINSAYDEVDSASDFSLIASDIIAPGGNVANVQKTEYAGVTVGADLEGLMSVGFSVASEYDWAGNADPTAVKDDSTTDGTANDERNVLNAYALGLEVEVSAIDMVTVTVVSNMEFGEPTGQTDKDGDKIAPSMGSLNNPAGIGLGVAYDMPMGDMTLTPEFGVDVVFETADSPSGKPAEDAPMGLDLEIGVGANLTWGDLGIVEDDADYFGLEDQETTSGVGFGVSYSLLGKALQSSGPAVNADGEYDYYSEPWVFVKLGLFEDEGDDGLLPVVGGAVIVNYNQYLGNEVTSDQAGTDVDYVADGYAQAGIGVELNADLGVVSPYFGFITGSTQISSKTDESGTTKTKTKAADWGLTVNLGTDINVISNTTFTIDWASGNLGNTGAFPYDENDYTIDAGTNQAGDDTSRLGVVTIATKVEF